MRDSSSVIRLKGHFLSHLYLILVRLCVPGSSGVEKSRNLEKF
ncbi:hypothetical protein NSP_49340 [Nodularia spumigena CCY9414]|nr:hypothetical protein NSP_49340 [Nodularia spumigena CCY9414]